MSEGNARGIVTALVGLLLVGATVSVPLFRQTDVATPRPASEHHEVHDFDSDPTLEKVEARLWEDPVEAYFAELARFERSERLRALGQTPTSSGSLKSERTRSPGTGGMLPATLAPFFTHAESVRQWLVYHPLSNRSERRFANACRRESEDRENSRAPEATRSPECRYQWPAPTDRLVTAIVAPTMRRGENAESRRGIRVALQTAMLSRGWDWRDEAAVGLTRIPLALTRHRTSGGTRPADKSPGTTGCRYSPASSTVNGSNSVELEVFFETFTHPSGARALVLWLDEVDLTCASDVALVARTLKSWVTKERAPRDKTDKDIARRLQARVSVIGPSSTRILVRWLNAPRLFDKAPGAGTKGAAREQKPTAPLSDGEDVTVYSPVVTVPDDAILREVQDGTGGPTAEEMASGQPDGDAFDGCRVESRSLQCLLVRHGIRFVRTTVTDDVYVQAVAEELRHRREAVKPRECNLVIVSEADSTYARTLKREIERRLRANPGEVENPFGPCRLLESKNDRAIGSYQYLSSINASGTAVADGTPGTVTQSQGSGQTGSVYASQEVRPGGRQQLDYVERLADKIEADVLDRRWDAEHVFAVGLLGLDASDKSTLLKLLRPKFPHARFFSIGLDAALLDPANLPYTRNLIVAATEGLDAGPEWASFPPFRRSSQVGYVRAFSAALDGADTVELPRRAGIFEVGLHGFIRLDSDPQVEQSRMCGLGCKLSRKADDLSRTQLFGAIALACTGMLSLLWLLHRFAIEVRVFVEADAARRSPRFGRASQRVGLWSRVALVMAMVAGTGYFWYRFHGAWVESIHGRGEPPVFFDGISLWVPTFLRGLTITVGVVALIVYLGRERFRERATFKKLGFFGAAVMERGAEVSEERQRSASLTPWPPRLWSAATEYLPFGPVYSGGSPMLAWRDVERKVCGLPVVAVLMGFWISVLMLGLLAVLDDPTMPSRGEQMAMLNEFASRVAMIVMFSIAIAVCLKQSLLKRFFNSAMGQQDCPWQEIKPRDSATVQRPAAVELRLAEDAFLRGYLDCAAVPFKVDVADERIRPMLWRSALADLAGKLLVGRTWTSYLPVFMISLMVLARYGLFENQTVPPVFWIFVVVAIALSLWNNVQLYRLAHSLRSSLVTDLDLGKIAFRGADGIPLSERTGSGASTASQEQTDAFFDLLIAKAKSLDKGPFAPLSEQPFVLALGIPALGTLIAQVVALYLDAL